MHSPKVNWLLSQLPETDYERLASHLELVGLDTGKQLFHTGQQYTAIFFPTTSTISAQIELEQGNTTDIYLLGARGLFGTGTTHRGTYFTAIVRKPGFAYRCPTEIYMREMTRGSGVMMISLLAMRIMMEEMATNISCRTFHSVGQQVARWLITYGQGEPVETIHITHSELANALGVRREAVTLALNDAERQGSVRLNRGHIKVLDYELLKGLACNCHTEPTLNKVWGQKELEGIGDVPSVLQKIAAQARARRP